MFWAMTAGVAITSAVVVPASLPILTPRTLAASGWAGGGEQQLETVGWPREVGLVDSAFRSLPAAQQSHAVILTANYGEAGAIDRFRARFGLPEAYSGLNAFGLWGPPPASDRPVVLVWEDPRPPTYLRGCREVRRVGGPVPNEEHDYARVFVCTGPRGTWASIWPHLPACRTEQRRVPFLDTGCSSVGEGILEVASAHDEMRHNSRVCVPSGER